jgi:alkanesulfonate monooxygenase SsuD/methylene tetrahydromethanopterin reductase-like flavin-dependent oxidoreductase (luciferase family)
VGRLKIAVGTGWQPEELGSLDSDFISRGPRTDEIIEFLRGSWETGSSAFCGEHYDFPSEDRRFPARS